CTSPRTPSWSLPRGLPRPRAPGPRPCTCAYVLGQTVVAILAVVTIGGEYSTGTIGVSLAAIPRRSVVLAAKAAVITGLVLAAGTVTVLASLLAGRRILPGNGVGPDHGLPALSLADGPVLRAAVGSVLDLVLIAL